MALRAVLVGINTFLHAPKLSGCINDLHSMETIVRARRGMVVSLGDSEATCAAQKQAIREMLAAAVPGDVLLYSDSSHGTWVRDKSGDEDDRRDESLVPYDFSFDDPTTWLTDDVFAQMIRDAALPPRVSLLLNTDACNSGTILRILVSSARPRFLTPPAWVMAPARSGWRGFFGRQPTQRRLGATFLKAGGKAQVGQLSAVTPTQFAADAYVDGLPQGAHTAALVKALAQLPNASLANVRLWMVRWLKTNGYGSQTPTLYGSVPMRARGFLEPQ